MVMEAGQPAQGRRVPASRDAACKGQWWGQGRDPGRPHADQNVLFSLLMNLKLSFSLYIVNIVV